MKKIILPILIFLIAHTLTAQNSISEINSNHKWVWLGLDFSETKLVGRTGFEDPFKIATVYFPSINMLIFEEAEKYDVMKAMNTPEWKGGSAQINVNSYSSDPFFFERTRKRLSLAEVYDGLQDLYVGVDYKLEKSDIEKIVSKYNFRKTAEDVALVFIMESLGKTSERAIMWVTVINTRTKKVLLSERMAGKPKGFGFRNYWGKSVLRVMEEIEKGNKYGYNITNSVNNLANTGDGGCGKKPVAPPKYNNPQYKQSKEYRDYRKKLNIWKTCTGSR